MELPENIADAFCKKRVVLTLEQLAEMMQCSLKKSLDELNIRYQDGWTFNKVVKDCLIETIRRKALINEMSFDRKTYRQNAINEMRLIVEYWCLCYYCLIKDPYNQNSGHWRTELSAHLENIKDTDIKKGCGNKAKVLRKTWIDEYDLNQSQKIERMIRGKFLSENIADKDIILFIASVFADEIESVITVLSDDEQDVDDYILERFPIYI